MSNGYTLVELLVVAAIIGIVSALSVWGFSNIQQDEIVITAANQMAGDIRNAKMRAKELQVGARVQVTGQTTYQVRYDVNRDGFGDAGDTVNDVTLPTGVAFDPADVAQPRTVVFTWKGDTGVATIAFTLNPGNRQKLITVLGVTGMVVIQ